MKTPDCLVMAADTRSSILTKARSIINFSDKAEKIMQIRDYPVGLLRWGLGSLAQRSLSDILSDFFNELPSLESDPAIQIDVAALAKQLLDFIKPGFDKAEEARESGIVIGGYTTGAHFPELYLLELKKDNDIELLSSSPILVLPDDGNLTQFGAVWFGQTNPLNRLLNGTDEDLTQNLRQWWWRNQKAKEGHDFYEIEEEFPFPEKEVESVLRQFKNNLACDQMHVQDAIDCATYLVNVVIGLNRFWCRAPLCGGEINVAVIKRTGFKLSRRKTWS